MPLMMFDDADGTLAMLRDSVATFAASHPGPASVRACRGRGEDLDRAMWRAMAEAGWLGLSIPEEHRGAGLSVREQAVLCEALGRALISTPLAQVGVMAVSLLTGAPAGETRDALLAGIADGSALVVPAWQKRDGEAAAVTAKRRGGELHLGGAVDLVSAPLSATLFLVVAGDAVVAVPAGTPGLAVTTRPTVDGSRLGAVTFTDCRVPVSALIAEGPAVAGLLDAAIRDARLALAAELAGIGGRALELTTRYTKDRVQFGKPIASFQAIQHRLVDMWSDAEFACAATVNAVETLLGTGGKAAELAVLAAKARAGDAAVTITRRAIHLHGAMGFTDEADIGLYMKRAVALDATLGQAETLRLRFVALERAA